MVHFQINRVAGIRVATFTGVVHERDLYAAHQGLLNEPDYDPALNDVVDFRSAEPLQLTVAAIGCLANYFDRPELPGFQSRLAIVASKDTVLELAQLYTVLRGGRPGQIQIFREMAEAESWLDSPATPRPPATGPLQ